MPENAVAHHNLVTRIKDERARENELISSWLPVGNVVKERRNREREMKPLVKQDSTKTIGPSCTINRRT